VYPDRYVVRVVNLTPDHLSIDASSLELNYFATRCIAPGEYEGYFVRDPGEYKFEFKLSSNQNLRPLRITLHNKATRIYTQYIIGTIDLNAEIYQQGYPLEMVISVDGNTVIRPCF
jgi:hypothetical protein